MAKSATGKGSNYGAGSTKATKPAPQPTKRASYAASVARENKFSKPR